MAGRLTDTAIRKAKPEEKLRKLFDGDGLFLHVMPNGSKLWRLRYWLPKDGRRVEKSMALGAYPEVSLKTAREKAAKARETVREGHDPILRRTIERAKVQAEQATSFESVARQWLEKQAKTCTPAHVVDCRQRLEKHVFPYIGALPMTEIDPPVVVTVLKRVQEGGHSHMAGRCRTMISQVYRYAIPHGLATRDPARDVSDVLVTKRVRHLPALLKLPQLVGLLRALDTSGAARTTKIAARLLALLALRTIEVRGGRWAEVDFDAATWTVSADRMKKRHEHVVPLSAQALTLLRELHALTGTSEYMFPGSGPRHPIMSEATINQAIKRAGYEGKHTGHGFRAAFSTILNDLGHRPDVIEYALAHVSGDRVRSAYNRGDYLRDRRVLMQAWADMIDSAAATANVNVTGIGEKRLAA